MQKVAVIMLRVPSKEEVPGNQDVIEILSGRERWDAFT